MAEAASNRFSSFLHVGVVGLCVMFLLCPAQADEKGSDTEYDWDIPAQDLGAALQAVALISNHKLLYKSELADGRSSQALKGSYSLQEAVEALLAGTDLTFEITPAAVVLIREPGAQNGDEENTAIAAAAGGMNFVGRSLRLAQAAARESEITQDQSRIDDEREKLPIEEIVVTGTNIRGIQTVASPLQVIDKEAIERAGFATAQEIVQSLPVNFNGGSSEITAGASNGGGTITNSSRGTGANLRGLGNDSTLVLINGHRVVPSNQGDYVDLSLIPTSAIERVEVLSDGASAIYGSDAIGGVINFVLRERYHGAETRIRGGYPTQGGADDYRLSQALGRSWKSGNALLAYEFYYRDNLRARDRAFTQDLLQPYDLLSEQKRHSVFVTASQELDERTEVSGSAAYSNRSVHYKNNVPSALVEGSPEVEQFSVSFGGLRRVGETWTAELYGTYGQSTTDVTVFHDGALIADRTFTPELYTVDLKLDGDVFELPGGAVKIAVGGQYRREDLYSSDTIGDVTANFDRNVAALFGEVYVPLVSDANGSAGLHRLDLVGAFRYEDYSDFGSTTDPKLGAVWSPVDGVNVRGTWSTSFRAPLLVELDEIGNDAAAISPAAFPFFGGAPSNFTGLVFTTGKNADLGPETATTWTAGVDIENVLIDGLTLNATYFDVQYEDRIASVFSEIGLFDVFLFTDELGPLLSNVTDPVQQQELFSMISLSFGVADSSEISHFLDGRTQNLSVTEEAGVDIGLSYSRRDRIGELSMSFNGTYITKFETKITPTAEFSDFLNTFENPVDWRFRAGVTWSNGAYSIAGFVNHTDSYRNTTGGANEKVDAWTTIDFTASVDFGEALQEGGLLQGLTLRAMATNLFDEDPPHVDGRELFPAFDGANASPIGRVVSLELVKEW